MNGSKGIKREEWIRTWMGEGRYKKRRMDRNINGMNKRKR